MTIRFVILVVDDEPDSADLLGMILGMHFPHATVGVAHGAQAALDLAARQRPDVVISDLEMPTMDGERLAVTLRACIAGAAPVLIALSGNVVRLSALRGAGVFDHQFSKPVDVASLVRLIEQAYAPSQSDRLGPT